MKKTFLFASLLFFAAVPAFAQRVGQAPAAGPLGVLGSSFASSQAQPQGTGLSDKIAIVVNEAVVTTSEVRNRIDLSLLSAGLPDAAEVRQKVSLQVVRALVDEQIEKQEAEKAGLSIGEDEIDEALKRIAADNKIPGGDMESFLRAHGIPPSTLRAQVKANLLWTKYVMRTLRPRVDIGEDEIDAVVQRMRSNAGKQEYLVSEIFLPVDRPEDEAEVKALAENLTSQLKGGAIFGAVARQFSQEASAGSGGDIGWIQSGQLSPEVDKVLQTLQAGEIAGPIRSASGYHILGVREKRTIALGDFKEMSVKLQQAFHPFGAEDDKEVLLREANVIRQTIDTCEDLAARVQEKFPGWRVQDLGEVKLASAPSWLADKVQNITQGHASDAMATNKGALMLFVCDRSMPENVDRGAIRNAIGAERLELLARRTLRDLRRDAFVDVRLKDVP